MSFLNRPRDYSNNPPISSIIPGVLSVVDTSSINLTFNSSLQILQADLVPVLLTPGTYGSASLIPVFTVNNLGQITSITQVPAAGGGGGIVTLDNGLTLTGTNGQLGGTLIKNTTVDGGTTYIMEFLSSVSSSAPTLSARNIGTGYAFWATSSNVVARLLNLNSSLNTVRTTLELRRGVAGTSDVGFGQDIQYRIQSNSGATYTSNRLVSELTDASPGNFTSKFTITGNLNNTELDLLTLYGAGNVRFNKYGLGAFTGTPTYYLAEDVNGNIIEVPIPGGGGGITSLNGQTGVSQTFANGASGTAPAFVSAANVHTLNIPLASVAGVTAGLISKAQYDSLVGSVYPYISQAYTGGLNPICILCNPSLDRLYVPSNFSNQIRVYVASTGVLVSTITLSGVWGLFIINGELWATTISAGIIYRYNASSGASLGTDISGSGNRGHTAYEFSSSKVFITNALSNNVTVINPSPGTVTATITGLGGTEPYGICYNNNPASLHFGLLAVILRGSNLITLINPTTNAVVAVGVNPSSSLGNPSGIIYNATNDRYYISNADATKQNIVMLSPSGATTFSVAGTIDGIAYADDLVQDTTTNKLYAGGHAAMTTLFANQFIYEIEMATNTVRKIIPTSLWNNTTTLHNNLAIDETNGLLYTNVGGGATNLGANVTFKLKLRP